MVSFLSSVRSPNSVLYFTPFSVSTSDEEVSYQPSKDYWRQVIPKTTDHTLFSHCHSFVWWPEIFYNLQSGSIANILYSAITEKSLHCSDVHHNLHTCSPFFRASGHKKYHTLAFPAKKRVPTRMLFSPRLPYIFLENDNQTVKIQFDTIPQGILNRCNSILYGDEIATV